MINLDLGELPDKVNVFIEIPQGSAMKYELDKESGVLFADRLVPVSMVYPINYGFIPGTHAEDGDCVDVLVLSTQPFQSGTAVKCRILGLLEMEDEEGTDTKIIAAPIEKVDAFLAHVNSIDDIPQIKKDQIKHFFDNYKDLEPGKWVKTGNYLGKEEPLEAIKLAVK